MVSRLHLRTARHLLLLGSIAAGCYRSSVTTVQVVAVPNANDTMAIEVDVLFVYQAKIAEELTALGATMWFDNRDQLLAKYNGKFFYVHWEVVPGTRREVSWQPETEEDESAAILVFADYVSGEPKLVDVTKMKDPLVYLCQYALALEGSC